MLKVDPRETGDISRCSLPTPPRRFSPLELVVAQGQLCVLVLLETALTAVHAKGGISVLLHEERLRLHTQIVDVVGAILLETVLGLAQCPGQATILGRPQHQSPR